jgi:glutathione S-transferase
VPAIVLHQWEISPFCGKVRRTLAYKQLAYEVVNYNGLRARKAARLSGAGKLPVLDYDGQRIQDSSDIVAFLETKHADPPLLPRDPVLRAEAHVWEDWADESLYWFEVYLRFGHDDARARSVALLADGKLERMIIGPAVKRMYRKKLAAQGLGLLEPAQVEHRFLSHLDALELVLTKKRWLVGDACTIADIAVGSQLAEVVRTSHLASEVTKRTHVGDWLAKL